MTGKIDINNQVNKFSNGVELGLLRPNMLFPPQSFFFVLSDPCLPLFLSFIFALSLFYVVYVLIVNACHLSISMFSSLFFSHPSLVYLPYSTTSSPRTNPECNSY